MDQSTFFTKAIWSIGDITRYLKDLLETDELLQDIWVRGEISNLARPASGHLYFSMKDASATLKCVMWRAFAARLKIQLREGMALEAHGSISIYETGGQYQLYVDAVRLAGEGDLYQEFLRLKARLESEGLFDPRRKRAVPEFPHIIGIVTSPTAAALRDILKTIQRRFTALEVYLAPTAVQGVEAPAGIVGAIKQLNEQIHPDVILLARGGGSIEDLWAFNDELVARAIYESEAPIITGIGHETDFTIADFVSDLRAPTPTGAAELATPDRDQLRVDINQRGLLLERAVRGMFQKWTAELQGASRALELRSPIRIINSNRQRLDEINRLSDLATAHDIQVRRLHLQGLLQSLETLNPRSVLERGFAMIQDQSGKPLTSVARVKIHDHVSVVLKDGHFPAVVSGKPTKTIGK